MGHTKEKEELFLEAPEVFSVSSSIPRIPPTKKILEEMTDEEEN